MYGASSWCLSEVFTFRIVSSFSVIILHTSGPETANRLRAAGFVVSPTTPPSSLIILFDCYGPLKYKIPFLKLLIYHWVSVFQSRHVPDMHWQPPCIMYMIQYEEPCYQLIQRIDVKIKFSFTQGTHILKHSELKL